MKIRIFHICSTVFILTVFGVSCYKGYIEDSSSSDDIRVSKWYNGSHSAISFIWDDTNENHYTQVAPIFNSYGYHASFAVITDFLWVGECIDGYKNILAMGHEICSHSHTHPNLTGLTENQIAYELETSKEAIQNFFDIIPLTFVHPYDESNDEVNSLVDIHYLFSRIHNKFQDLTNSIVIISNSTGYEQLIQFYEEGLEINNWTTIAGHGLDEAGYEPIKSDDLKNFLSFLLSETNTWVDTYARIALYNEIRLKINSINIKADIIEIDDSSVDYTRYNNFEVPELPITIEMESSTDQIRFEGDNVLLIKYENNKYFITIDLLKGNDFQYYIDTSS